MYKLLYFICLVVVYSQMAGCQQRAASNEVNAQNPDLINNTFPEARTEIQKVLDGSVQSLIDRDADKLISYHEYEPKFTEFKNGMSRPTIEGEMQQLNYQLTLVFVNTNSGWKIMYEHFSPLIAG